MSYWKKRFEALEAASNKYGIETYRKIEPAFDSAFRQIESEITLWYERLAKNNGVTMQEARQWLNANELKEFQWDVQEYIKYGRENAINQQWIKELENASAKYHISRLEALKVRTQQAVEVAFGNELDEVDAMVKKIFTNDYYHSIYEMQKGFNIGWEIGQIDERKLEKIVSSPWATDGKHFSERIWNSRTQLVSELHNQLTRTCILGKPPDDAIKAISKKFNTSKNQAGRLVMTEQAYFHSVAQQEAFKELDVEEFEVVATLDNLTSEICQEMDGKHFPMKDYEPGVTAPPFHPWCRSVTVPYFDDDFDVGERATRDEDGETYYVPADMTYPEWQKSFVDGQTDDLKSVVQYDIIKMTDEHLKVLTEKLEDIGVAYNPVKMHKTPLSEEEIINVLSGGDKTSGSCASVGLAYVGQKAGMNVLDFRGGASQNFFSTYLNLKEITKFPGIEPIFETAKASLTVGNKLLKKVVQGKEYYLCVGQHCAIVRRNADSVLQYLELQSPTRSEWTDFNGNPRFTLASRFGCQNGRGDIEEGFMIDVEQFEESDELQTLLGYINTVSDEQKKGVTGHVR